MRIILVSRKDIAHLKMKIAAVEYTKPIGVYEITLRRIA